MAAVRWWRKWWVWLIAGGVVLLGLTAWGAVAVVSAFQGIADDVAAEDEARKPFELALDDLAQTAAVHQQGTTNGVAYDLRVTSDGDALGTFSVDGEKYRVLRIGDKEYVKPPSGTLAGPGATEEMTSELDKRWLVNEGDTALPIGDLVQTPKEYAEYLRSAVQAADAPTPDAPAEEVEIGGVPALWTDTPVGPVYVSKEPPYEVLRVDPSTSSGASSGQAPGGGDAGGTGGSGEAAEGAGGDDAAGNDGSSAEGDSVQNDPGQGDSVGGGDVLQAPEIPDSPSMATQMSQDEVADLFDEMIGLTPQLKTAVNPNITFDMNGQAQVSCTAGGCSSNVQMASNVSTSQGTVQGGTVTGQLVSVFRVQGGTAGTCRASSNLALQGTSSMSCSSPAAGGVFAAADAREGAKAQSRANACRCKVSYEVPYSVDAQVVALAQVRVGVLRSGLDDRRKKLMDQGAFCSFAGTTPVLMGDGTRKAIQDIAVGDEVWAADPVSGERGPREVTHVWVHQDELFELEIDGETILTTEDHPFWSVTDQRFERADDLEPGERVLGADGRLPMVTESAVRPSGRPETAYNLAVVDIHTYHVNVGEADVLVHNANCPKFVKYAATDLGIAALKARESRGFWGGDRNVAVARVQGHEGLVVGVSRQVDGKLIHAEQDVIRQLGKNDRVMELYSERRPCPDRCAGLLNSDNRFDDAKITYTVEYATTKTAEGREFNKLYAGVLADLVRDARHRRGM